MTDELYQTPDEFALRVSEAGGYNRYDEPNFKIVWQRSEFYRAGGVWAGNGQPVFTGYRWIPQSFEQGWALMQWNPPEKYGTPESYYVQNCDEQTNLQILGEYPYSGRYEVVMPFIWKGMVNGRLVVEHLPLSSFLIDAIVPIIKESRDIPNAKKRAVLLARKEAADREQTSQIEARLRDAYPAFGTASRSAASLECNSLVQKKAEAIEKHWKRAVGVIRQRGRGLSVG